MKSAFAAAVLMMLEGCVSASPYGKIAHDQLSAGSKCNPQPGSGTAAAAYPYFLVSSRLPDCRSGSPVMTAFRSEVLRYGTFGTPDLAAKMRRSGQRTPLVLTASDVWWSQLQQSADSHSGQVLLYVHGYRQSLDEAANDTRQIGRLTKFDGPVIAYAWPSEDKLAKYIVDETNMYWDERNFRNFLAQLASQPWVNDITVVSHSMGARLVIPAIEFIDLSIAKQDATNISNIILTSPDIDRENFERDIAKGVLTASRVNSGRHITVYVSGKDKALALSRVIHGYPRLGSPYCYNPFEAAEMAKLGLARRCYARKSNYAESPRKSGFTIVDTTDVSLSTAGHSDFLASPAACKDFVATVRGARDKADGRVPTALDWVFQLSQPRKLTKAEIKAACAIE